MTQFSANSAKRISTAVKYVETMVKNRVSGTRRRPTISPTGFWAMLVDKDGEGKYSWAALEALEGGTTDINEDWGYGDYSDDGYAVEVWGAKDVLNWVCVYLTPARTDDYYIFSWEGGVFLAEMPEELEKIEKKDKGTVNVIRNFGETDEYDEEIEVWNDFNVDIERTKGKTLFIAFSDGYWKVVGQGCGEPQEEEEE